MKRHAWRLLFPCLVAGAVIAVPARADVLLIGFTGFDYVTPHGGPASGTFISQLDNYDAVGFVTAFGPDLTGSGGVNPVANEYTFHLGDAVAGSVFYDGVSLEVDFNNNARIRVFEDSRATGTPASYGTNPPNGTVPSSFVDGNLAIGADLDQLVLTFDFTTNQGAISTNLATVDEGAYLSLIPVSQRAGWLLSGLAGRPNNSIPDGYVNQLSGEMNIPSITPAQHKTWGQLKALYR